MTFEEVRGVRARMVKEGDNVSIGFGNFPNGGSGWVRVVGRWEGGIALLCPSLRTPAYPCIMHISPLPHASVSFLLTTNVKG